MKFDKYGRRVRESSSIQSFNGLGPDVIHELSSLGIGNDSLRVIADMVIPEKSERAFRIILKMARSNQGQTV